MAKSTTFSSSILSLIFNGTSISGLADNTATSPLTTLYCSLHTADPTAGGNQTSSEATYGGYARVGIARTGSGWIVTSNSVSPAATVIFPAGTSGSGTATNWAVGTAATGTGEILYTGPIVPTIPLGSGVTPEFTTGSMVTES